MQPSGLGAPAGALRPGRSFAPNLVEDVIARGTKTIEVTNQVERTIYTLGEAKVVTEQAGRIIISVNPWS